MTEINTREIAKTLMLDRVREIEHPTVGDKATVTVELPEASGS